MKEPKNLEVFNSKCTHDDSSLFCNTPSPTTHELVRLISCSSRCSERFVVDGSNSQTNYAALVEEIVGSSELRSIKCIFNAIIMLVICVLDDPRFYKRDWMFSFLDGRWLVLAFWVTYLFCVRVFVSFAYLFFFGWLFIVMFCFVSCPKFARFQFKKYFRFSRWTFPLSVPGAPKPIRSSKMGTRRFWERGRRDTMMM